MKPSGPSQDQEHLAQLLGVNLATDTFDVAAARLLDRVAAAIGYESSEPSSERRVTGSG